MMYSIYNARNQTNERRAGESGATAGRRTDASESFTLVSPIVRLHMYAGFLVLWFYACINTQTQREFA